MDVRFPFWVLKKVIASTFELKEESRGRYSIYRRQPLVQKREKNWKVYY